MLKKETEMNGIHQATINQLKSNVLVHLVKQAGGLLVVSVKDIDDACEMLMLESDPIAQTFTFRLVPDKEGTH